MAIISFSLPFPATALPGACTPGRNLEGNQRGSLLGRGGAESVGNAVELNPGKKSLEVLLANFSSLGQFSYTV